MVVTEPVPFDRSTRRIGLGIEPQHDSFALQVRKAHGLAVLVLDLEGGGALARFEAQS